VEKNQSRAHFSLNRTRSIAHLVQQHASIHAAYDGHRQVRAKRPSLAEVLIHDVPVSFHCPANFQSCPAVHITVIVCSIMAIFPPPDPGVSKAKPSRVQDPRCVAGDALLFEARLCGFEPRKRQGRYSYLLIRKTDARDVLYEVRWIQQSWLGGGGREWKSSEVVQSRGSAVNEEERSTDWRERD
jgi:hypothetical protein